MTVLALVVTAITLLILLAVLAIGERNQSRLLHDRAAERGIADADRAELLAQINRLADRIQHPERIQVVPAPDYRPPEPPTDAAELAFVGQEVPEFVQIGSNGNGEAED